MAVWFCQGVQTVLLIFKVKRQSHNALGQFSQILVIGHKYRHAETNINHEDKNFTLAFKVKDQGHSVVIY